MSATSDAIRSAIEMMDFNHFSVGSSHRVKVTHIYDPSNFYVRLASLSDVLELLEVQGSPLAVEEVRANKRVVYRSETLKKYVRGYIESVVKGVSCKILAVDYGCRDSQVQLKDIYTAATNIQCPALTLHCQLYLCGPKGDTFDADAVEAMKFFVGEHIAKITIMMECLGKYTVELRTVECPDDVSTMLALLHYTRLSIGVNTVNRFTIGDPASDSNEEIKYKYRDLKEGDQLFVRIQCGDTISNFYVAEINDHKKYISSKSEFTEYCKEQKTADVADAIVEKKSCGVRLNNGEYERAIVRKITETNSKALVKLIDVGKEIELPFYSIKPVTSKYFTTRPACAIYCSSKEEQMWKTSLPSFFYPGYQFIIKIMELGNNMDVPHKVNIFPINK